jgi:hypothetical protein
MSAYSLDLREREDRRVGEERSPQGRDRSALRGRSRYSLKRYTQAELDERGTLESRKAPGKDPKLDETKAMRVLAQKTSTK